VRNVLSQPPLKQAIPCCPPAVALPEHLVATMVEMTIVLQEAFSTILCAVTSTVYEVDTLLQQRYYLLFSLYYLY
jgi:hypothetical protein